MPDLLDVLAAVTPPPPLRRLEAGERAALTSAELRRRIVDLLPFKLAPPIP